MRCVRQYGQLLNKIGSKSYHGLRANSRQISIFLPLIAGGLVGFDYLNHPLRYHVAHHNLKQKYNGSPWRKIYCHKSVSSGLLKYIFSFRSNPYGNIFCYFHYFTNEVAVWEYDATKWNGKCEDFRDNIFFHYDLDGRVIKYYKSNGNFEPWHIMKYKKGLGHGRFIRRMDGSDVVEWAKQHNQSKIYAIPKNTFVEKKSKSFEYAEDITIDESFRGYVLDYENGQLKNIVTVKDCYGREIKLNEGRTLGYRLACETETKQPVYVTLEIPPSAKRELQNPSYSLMSLYGNWVEHAKVIKIIDKNGKEYKECMQGNDTWGSRETCPMFKVGEIIHGRDPYIPGSETFYSNGIDYVVPYMDLCDSRVHYREILALGGPTEAEWRAIPEYIRDRMEMDD